MFQIKLLQLGIEIDMLIMRVFYFKSLRLLITKSPDNKDKFYLNN